MAKSIPGQLSMFSLWNSEDLPNATSLQESVGGDMPCVLLDGLTTAPSGQVRARASRSHPQAKEPVQTTQGIYGPTSIVSSPPTGPLSSWENRLRERLAMVGLTECALIWREKITPAGASISQLVPSALRTSGSVSIGFLPTPCASEARDISKPLVLAKCDKGGRVARRICSISPMTHSY